MVRGGRAHAEDAFAVVERRLDHGGWLFGDWTVIDAYLLWVWFRATGGGVDGGEFPACADHARRCEERPSVAKVLDREEVEFAKLEREGRLGPSVPPHQVGRAPRF